MSQKDASATRPYRGLVFDTRAFAVSKLGCTNLIFIEAAAKVNGQYYRDVLLCFQPSAALLEMCLSSIVFMT